MVGCFIVIYIFSSTNGSLKSWLFLICCCEFFAVIRLVSPRHKSVFNCSFILCGAEHPWQCGMCFRSKYRRSNCCAAGIHSEVKPTESNGVVVFSVRSNIVMSMSVWYTCIVRPVRVPRRVCDVVRGLRARPCFKPATPVVCSLFCQVMSIVALAIQGWITHHKRSKSGLC